MHLHKTLFGILVLSSFLGYSHAQDYPSKPIRWVMPFSVGGGSDNAARLMAPKLGKLLGGTVVIENRPGAGGMIGTDLAAKAAPDGYTLLWGGSAPLAVSVTLQKNLPYDPLKDFTPICRIGAAPYILAVNPELGVRTIKDLVDLSRTKSLTYASPGNGTGSHIAMEWLKAKTGMTPQHVTYKGTAPAVTDVLAGHVGMLFETVSPLAAHIRSGKLVPLGMSGAKRLVALPDIPTLQELGFADFRVDAWVGLLVPTATPQPVVRKLSDACRSILAEPEVQSAFVNQFGLEVDYATQEEFASLMRSEIPKWAIRDSR